MEFFGPLHEYQQRAVRLVLEHDAPALFLEPGLGKTMSALEIIYQKRLTNPDMITLIVAPLMVCETVWCQEVDKWGYPLRVQHLSGDPTRRLKLLHAREADVYLVTPDLLKWLFLNGHMNIFGYCVIDELTYFKNSTSQRWRSARQCFRMNPVQRLGLTGTPVPNGYHSLWASLMTVDSGRTLGRYKGEWEEEYFHDISIDPTKYSSWVLRRGARDNIHELLKDSYIESMTAEKVLGQKRPIALPNIIIRMPKKSQEIYDELEQEMTASMPDGTDVLIEHENTIGIKLRQVASGFMYDEDGVIHRLHDEKMKATKSFIDGMDGEPVIIVYNYNPELMQLRSLFPKAPDLSGQANRKQRIEALRAWNNEELAVLLVQSQSAAHGINAQDGGHHFLFYSSNWDLEIYEQVIARLNRQGQKSTVFIRHMVGGAVEDNIIKRLNAKSRLQICLMEDLQNV